MLTGPKDVFRIGDHAAICDACGAKFYASELKRRWDGMMVCRSDFEIKHPQLEIKSIPETKQVPPWVRPPAQDNFIDDNDIAPPAN